VPSRCTALFCLEPILRLLVLLSVALAQDPVVGEQRRCSRGRSDPPPLQTSHNIYTRGGFLG
jgi:hypothetical protein